MQIFSPAQVVGYLALALGIAAFLQKSDRRLKLLISAQSFFYAVHFFLLGALPASTSAFVNSARSLMAIRYRSFQLSLVMIAINLALGVAFVRSLSGCLPVIGSCITTYAMFNMQGVRFRIVLFCSTLLWLTNDLLTGSIGGTILESTSAAVNLYRTIQMSRAPARRAAAGV
jgi:hypothetical protein